VAATNPGLTGMVAYWDLDEASGNRADSFGSNTLVDNNTVGSAAFVINNGSDHEASNSEYFTVADNSDLSMGDIDFWFAGWVKLESLSVNALLVWKSKNDSTSTNDREYSLAVNTSGDMQWLVSNDTSNGQVTWSTSLSLATKYFVVVYHDSVNNLVGISIDGAAFQTSAWSGGSFDSNGSFVMGRQALTGSNKLDGLMDEWQCRKASPPTIDDVEWMYNSGDGRPYASYSATLVSLSGSFTSSGTSIKKIEKPLAGALTLSGILLKNMLKNLYGAFTSSGILSVGKVFVVAIQGAITFAGSVLKKTSKIFTGALTFIGTLLSFFSGNRIHLTMPERDVHFSILERDKDLTIEERDTRLVVRKRQ